MISDVIRGAATTATTEFYNPNSTPFVGIAGAVYSIFDINNVLVTSGTGTQDPQNTQRWSATFTIPDNAPITFDGSKYRITWMIQGAAGSQTNSESFTVHPYGGTPDLETDCIVVAGQPMYDTLSINPEEYIGRTISNVLVSTINSFGTTLFSASPGTPTNINGRLVYTYSPGIVGGISPNSLGVNPYINMWNVAFNVGQPLSRAHIVVCVNARMMIMINDMRMKLDRLRNRDINPNLRFTDFDYIKYLMIGLQKVNASKPTLTNYSFSNLPLQLQDLTIKSAEKELLQAQYLAEGMSQFDMSGASVTLNNDHTQYISTLIDQIQQELDANLATTKKLLQYKSGAGSLVLTQGPTNVLRGSYLRGGWNNPILMERFGLDFYSPFLL